MGILVRIIGWLLTLVALGALTWDVLILLDTGLFKFSTWGEIWYALDPGSLNLYQAVVERYLHPVIWDKVLAPLLLYRAFFFFAITGLTLATLPRIIYLFKRVFGEKRHA